VQPQTFIAESAADAIAQIRDQLGPEAVVLSVKQRPATGLGRLFQRRRIEVTACVPDKPAPAADPLEDIKRQLAELRQQFENRSPAPASGPLDILMPGGFPASGPVEPPPNPKSPGPPWARPLARAAPPPSSAAQILEKIGILPLYIEKVLGIMDASRSEAPSSVAREVEQVCAALKSLWRERAAPDAAVHIFIGPPGSGKTTCLCKWLAKAILVENRRARVWRLDCAVANAAESLSVYAEILGAPVERFRPEDAALPPGEMLFIDLPGIAWKDAVGMETLAKELGEMPAGHVHLALNAAYEAPILLQQIRAYSRFMIFDLILTHLDEEPRWGKLWNLVLGASHPIGWMSAGQNIPGDFHPATAQMLFDRHFFHK